MSVPHVGRSFDRATFSGTQKFVMSLSHTAFSSSGTLFQLIASYEGCACSLLSVMMVFYQFFCLWVVGFRVLVAGLCEFFLFFFFYFFFVCFLSALVEVLYVSYS